MGHVTNTWYVLPAYKIWQLSLQPFREYDCGRQNRKMGHVKLTMPLSGWFVILRLGYDIVYLCTKCDDSSFSQSRDITGTAKF